MFRVERRDQTGAEIDPSGSQPTRSLKNEDTFAYMEMSAGRSVAVRDLHVGRRLWREAVALARLSLGGESGGLWRRPDRGRRV